MGDGAIREACSEWADEIYDSYGAFVISSIRVLPAASPFRRFAPSPSRFLLRFSLFA